MLITPTDYTKAKLFMMFFMDLVVLFFIYFVTYDIFVTFIVFLITLFITFNLCLASAKTISLNKKGLEIKFLFIKETYSWDEVKVKRIEKHNMIFGFDVPPELTCIIFSKRKYFKPQFISPATYCEFNPLRFDFVYLNLIPKNYSAEKLPTNYAVYPIDEELFYSKMKEWDIELEK